MLNKRMLGAGVIEQESWLKQTRGRVLELSDSLEMVLNRLVSRLGRSEVAIEHRRASNRTKMFEW